MSKHSPAISSTADRFRKTRAAHSDETAEDYAEAVQQLIDTQGEARIGELARLMGVSHVTVTRIISRLQDEGLVLQEPYKPVTLTARGAKLAKASHERHEVVLRFLCAIGVPRKQAEIDTEGIEHHVSAQTIKAMRKLLRERQG
jgi:DtxR family manganese transport transcriptional regulator